MSQSAEETRLAKPKPLFGDALLPENSDEIAKFVDEPLPAALEFLTGLVADDKKALFMKAGYFMQAVLQAKGRQEFNRQVKDWRTKGRIRSDFPEDDPGTWTWVEIMKSIDDGDIEKEKLDAMKALFCQANQPSATDEQRIAAYQIFKIAKSLDSGKLRILSAAYELNAGPSVNVGMGNVKRWAQTVAAKLGHGLSALVLKDEAALMAAGLINQHRENSVGLDERVSDLNKGRLTDLGMRLCETIRTYNLETSEDGN